MPVSSEWLPKKERFKSYITLRLVCELYLKLKLCLNRFGRHSRWFCRTSLRIRLYLNGAKFARNAETRKLGQFVMQTARESNSQMDILFLDVVPMSSGSNSRRSSGIGSSGRDH